MKKEELLKEKDLLFKEILALRKELKSANDNILNAGKSIPFYKVVGPPLII